MRLRAQGLDVKVVDGLLTITIGVETLAQCAENGPLWPTVKVKDVNDFAAQVADHLKFDEREDGSTPLHRVLDDAMEGVVCDGHDSVLFDPDHTGDSQDRPA
jgi:hypothetical protein